ncbi:MAG TPA: acyl carrier protein [Armatimonadota bacterium]|nr:acyl carrier protein [Armatimonadota bacterium]
MSDQRVEDRIKELMVERLFLKIQPEDIGDDEPIMEAYGVDSVNLFELVAGLEEEYDITFEDTDFNLESFQTVASIAELVREKQKVEA